MTHPDDAPKYGRYGPKAKFTVELTDPDGTKVVSYGDDILETTLRAKTELARAQAEPRRDPFGIVLSLVFLTIAALLTWGALNGGWWNLLWLIQGPFAVLGAVGLLEDARKHPRDEDGRRIR